MIRGALKKVATAAGLLALLPASPARAQDIPSLIANGHLRRALAAAEALPHTAIAAFYKSQIEIQILSLRQAALADAETAVKMEPDNSEYQCQLAESAGARSEVAGAFERIRLLKIIRESSAKGLEADPKNLTCLTLMELFSDRAPGIIGGDKQKAIEFAKRIEAVDPARGDLELAALADANNRHAEADAYRVKAVAANGKNYDARVALAEQYLRSKDFAKAEAEAGDAIALNAGRAAAYALAAASEAHQQKWAALDKTIAAAEHAVPDDAMPEYSAGKVLIEMDKELPRAERYFRGYLASTPELGTPPLATAHWRVGQVLEKQGQKEEALAEYKEASRLDPKLEQAVRDRQRLAKS